MVAERRTPTNARLLSAARSAGFAARLLAPDEASRRVRPDEIVLARLDVLPTLDGVEDGLAALETLELGGLHVLNRAQPLLACHDKLRTADSLRAADLPHPMTVHVRSAEPVALTYPVVVKPRFGSWGRDVMLCRTPAELGRCLADLAGRPWFGRHGALVQEFVDAEARDLRVIVAGGEVVGAIERVARPGEWRTNVALGGRRRPTRPSAAACATAVAAARAVSMDVVGVDLLPAADRYVIVELNGAVDFTPAYSLDGENVFAAVARQLVRLTGHEAAEAAGLSSVLAPVDDALQAAVQ